MRMLLIALVAVSVSSACGSKNGGNDAATDEQEEEATTGDSTDAGDADEEEFMGVCNPGSSWTPSTRAFRNGTEEWGLVGITGVRLSVTDIDSDGWPDLLVRNGGGSDDFSPGGERRRWVLRNTGDGAFEDVTHGSGLLTSRTDPDPDVGRRGDLWITGDVDNDGDLDIFTGSTRVTSTDDHSEIMLNNGDSTFSLGPEASAARFDSTQSKPLGATFVDFDRDGNLDLWVAHHDNGTNPSQDRLLRGDGTGMFTDVTLERGLSTAAWSSIDTLNRAEAHSWAWSSLACDVNNDGIPELLASSYGRAPNHLWRATSDGGYVNESVASGYAYDHRDDWTLDLNAQCHCEDNPSDEDCDLAPTPADYSICRALWSGFGGMYRWDHEYGREPFRLGGNSGTTVCADVNNDGWFDLMTHEIVHWDVGQPSDPSELMINLGDPLVRFGRPGNDVTGLERVDASTGWDHGDMTGAVFDFDNDGWPDVYIGASDYPDNKALLFHQSSPLEFDLLEIEDYFLHYRAHGVAVADFDRDGDLDIAVGHSRMRCEYAPHECNDVSQIRLFINTMGDESNWIQLELEGTTANRSAIGARVAVTADGTTQLQQVDGGHGQLGIQHDLVLHFGLGEACEAEVTITWSDADSTTQTLTLYSGGRYHVVQGEDPVFVP